MTLTVSLPSRLRLRARVPITPAGRLAFTRRGDRLLVAAADGTAVVEAASGRMLERWKPVYSAFACGAEDSVVACADTHGCVDLWRFGRMRPGEATARHEDLITAIAFSGDDTRIFTSGLDGKLGIFAAATLEARFFSVGGRAHDLGYDGASETVAVAAGRSGVVLFDARSGAKKSTLRPPDRARAVAFAGARLFCGTRSGQLAVWDLATLLPARATADARLGELRRLLPLGDALLVEGEAGLALLDAERGDEILRWQNGASAARGTIAVHAGTSAIACAVPGATAIIDLAPAEAPAATPPEVLVLHHPDEAALVATILEHLGHAGARVRDGSGVVECARRGHARALVLYGPKGRWPRHDYQLDVLATHGARVTPVILPGGAAPADARFHAAAYVCFHERVADPDALRRVRRALLGDRAVG